MSRSEQSNKMSIRQQMFQVHILQSPKIFPILKLKMLDELQQNAHFHWHLSPLNIWTEEISKNHRNILSHTVCVLSSIAQTTPKFCNSSNWYFPWIKTTESSTEFTESVFTFEMIQKKMDLHLKCSKRIFSFSSNEWSSFLTLIE